MTDLSAYELIFLVGGVLGWVVILLMLIGAIDEWRSKRSRNGFKQIDDIFSEARLQMERVRREQAQ